MISRAIVELGGRWFIRLALAAAMTAVLFPFTAHAQGVGKQLLQGHKPPAIARFNLQPLSRLPVTNRLNLAIGLPLRNQSALNKLLSEIYDPSSTNYHRYLTPEQFTEQFGPTEQDYQALITFAQTNGLTVTATHPNRTLLDVSGKVPDVERVFHVALHVYRHPTENRSFFAPDSEPSIDFNLPILHVSGLDNFFIPRPAIVKKNLQLNKLADSAPALGSGPSGNYMGKDFRAAYVPDTTLNGAGQIVGLFELDGYFANDILIYETNAGLPNITLTNILVDGYSGSAGGNNIEVALDIEMAIAMATNLFKVVVYEEQNGGVIADMLNRIASDNLAKQISSSWLIGNNPSYDTAYLQMAAQGQSFFQASGDDDAYFSGIAQWADDTNITLVGGTTLSTIGPGGSWSSEKVWNWYSTGQGTGGSGGGVNFHSVPIPIWQTGLNMTTNLGSTTLRNVPDVALTADNIFVVANNGQLLTGVGGTSAAAPLWAGYTALINQQAALVGSPFVGFLNPAIYAIGKSAAYAANFHDITTGNNTNLNVLNKWFAIPGYDLCTGWGTPNGQKLINTLVPPDTLGIVMPNGFTASGPTGGPFTPSSQTYLLTNTSASSLTWSLINTSAWLNASASSGTLAAGATNYLTISVTTAATNLAAGTYAATVKLTNWNTQVAQNLQFTLQALQPLAVIPASGFISGGPVGGPFSVTSQNFIMTNTGPASLTCSLINTSAWLTASGGGTLGASGSTMATVSLNSIATNFATGIYTANVWFTNQTGGGALSRQFSLLVNQSLVQNGGFETGDFTGWTLSNNVYTAVDTSTISGIVPHGGTHLAALGDSGTPGYLSQTLSTVPNQSYLLSLWLNSPTVTGGNTPNEFGVAWNGITLFDQLNIPPITGWSNLQFIVTATAYSTLLKITERVDPWYLGLDDVSVLPIPTAAFQPTTVTKTNNNLKFTWGAMTGLVYQVQFNTNLLQTNWTALKTITATNTPVTFVDTNPITGSPQKFYRLLLLP